MLSRRDRLIALVTVSSLAMLASAVTCTAANAASAKVTTSTTLLRVAFASANRGVGLFATASSAGSGSGRCVLYTRATDDGGSSWRPLTHIGGSAGGTAQVTFVGPRDGWVLTLGSGAELWRTRDAGRTWQAV
ncbi:MAG: hypothetical protein KGL16_13860 [Acidobacteriota bacterium]|nr:hypothetical protein [Acidobacteriota bacterium]